MNFKKFLSLGFILVSALALTACDGEEEVVQDEVVQTTGTETVESEVIVPEEPPRDLGGLVVTIASWADVKEPEEKKSGQEEALWEYRNEMMEKHNFGFEELGLSAWNGTLELMSTSVLAGDPAAEVFRFNANFNGAAKESGLCYDLATLDSINLEDAKWSQSLIELMSDGEKVYGISLFDRPKRLIFFNKRLFEEAGLDAELLYDLQASGEWTWDAFMEISEKLTRDTDNDGVNDVYALIMNQSVFAQAVNFSNGSSYVAVDENGDYYNNLVSPESMAALEWCEEYWATDYDIRPEHYNGHKDLFMSGAAAMYIGDEWESTNFTQETMPDDWGMVVFPKGPNADNYVVVYNEKAWVIPNSYTKEEAEDIAFALDLWTDPVPGYDDPDSWMTAQYPVYRDARAVEETLVIARDPEVMASDYALFIAQAVRTSQAAEDVYWNRATPTEAVEAQVGIWQAELDRLNAK
ncbi:MAG: hypothetical protein ATN31_02030 [Candidatus Epulonipiscioides saccharophilum]|nr:MAG: hypothetical protein ATN31_02030 [Epulopiscium sp. AS2M-Bin001]